MTISVGNLIVAGGATVDTSEVLSALNKQGLKVWVGTKTQRDALPENIKNDDKITFLTYDSEEDIYLIIDTIISYSKTWSSVKISTELAKKINSSDVYTKTEVMQIINSKVESALKYKGAVATVAALPSSGQENGDSYYVQADGYMYAWSSDYSDWQALGSATDMTNYYTKSEVDALLADMAIKFQYTTMPTADSTTVGKIIQYTGADTQDYKNGYWYKGVDNGDSTYSWSLHSVGDYYTKSEIEEITAPMVTTTTGAKVESMTQAEYDALATKDSKTLYNITDKSSIINDFNEASNDNTFSASLIKNSFLTSQATFTISSNEDLAKWATNASGNDYTSVYIAPGTYTLESGSINLTTTGTKIVEGHPNAKLVFESTSVAINTNYYPALYYTTKPDSQEYKMTNVIIDVTGMNATSSNVYAVGFYNCINMLNCYATSKSTGTKNWQAAYSYYACSYLINCQGASSGANNGNAYTFASCSYLTNCIADETVYPATYDNRADIIPYASSNYLINCQARATNGYELTRGYFGCNYLTGCSATVSSSTTTSTEISGFNRCSRMVNCQASITNTSGKTLTNIGGFINSTMLDNCVSNDQIYNSSYVFKCNASAYTSSYVDNYSTACADTSTGGYNHIGILSWSSNKWQ